MPIGAHHTEYTKKLLSKLRTTHGCSQPSKGQRYRTWLAWRMMFQRCENPNHKSYNDYGGRGIMVCKRWSEFEPFLLDMGVKPKGMTLGRIDNDLGYWSGNCEWQTQKTQCRNRRSNTLITFDGKTKTLQEWSEIVGIPRDAIGHRFRLGWTIEEALTLPAKRQKNSRASFTL